MHSAARFCLFLLAFLAQLALSVPVHRGTSPQAFRVATPPLPGAPPPPPRVIKTRPIRHQRKVRAFPPQRAPPPPKPIHGGIITVAGSTYTLHHKMDRIPISPVADTWILTDPTLSAKQFRINDPNLDNSEKQRIAFRHQEELNKKPQFLSADHVKTGDAAIQKPGESGEIFAWIVGPAGQNLRDTEEFKARYAEGYRVCKKYVENDVRKEFIRKMVEFENRTSWVHLNPIPANTIWAPSGTRIRAFVDYEVLDKVGGTLFESVKQKYLAGHGRSTVRYLATALASEYYNPDTLCPIPMTDDNLRKARQQQSS